MSTCTKEFELVVDGLNPAVWYSMESVGASIPDVSGHGADLLLVFGAAATAAAGKVALAATKFNVPTRYDATNAILGYPGTGDINIFFWSKINSPAASGQTTQVVGAQFNAIEGCEVTLLGSNVFEFVTNNGLVVSGGLAMGAFIFVRLHYDSSTHKFGIGFNNGAMSYDPNIRTLVPGATGVMTLVLKGSFLDPGNSQQCDELCLFFGNMSQMEIDGIYNGGAGRSFP